MASRWFGHERHSSEISTLLGVGLCANLKLAPKIRTIQVCSVPPTELR